jgi:membrane-anchored glycerophosphoryl diester phosphodiesterase (GDPDase)
MLAYSNGQVKISWELLKATVSLLLKNRRFLVFPVISLLCIGGVIVTFVYPSIAGGNFKSLALQKVSLNFYLYLFLFYLIVGFITMFFNSALITVVYKMLSGEDAILMDGIACAVKNIRTILVFAFLSSTIGFILYKIAAKFSFAGKLFAAGVDLAWQIAVYFTLPLVIIEGEDIFSAIKKSSQMMKKNWGNVLVSNFTAGAGLLSVALLTLIIFLPIAAVLGFSDNTLAAFLLGGTGFVLFFIVGFSASVFEVVYSIVLYRYISLGFVEPGYKEEYLKNAFIPDKSKTKNRK